MWTVTALAFLLRMWTAMPTMDYSGTEIVKVYDWDGQYKGIFKAASVSEHKAIFNYGGKYYIGFCTGSGGRVYEIHYDFILLEG